MKKYHHPTVYHGAVVETYIGLVHKDEDSDYGVSFPDFPGCVSVGLDLADLMERGLEALQLHIDGMKEEGLKIPLPSTAVMLEGYSCEGVALFTVITEY